MARAFGLELAEFGPVQTSKEFMMLVTVSTVKAQAQVGWMAQGSGTRR